VLTDLLTFAAAGALVVLIPGPDTMVMLRSVVLRGRRGALLTMAGVLTGLTIWASAAALGLAALLRASHDGYLALRIVGAAYLITMGVRALLSRGQAVDGGLAGPARSRRGGILGTGYRAGLTTDLLNPKVGVFFVTFLPAFIPHGDSVGLVSAILGAVFVVETAIYLALMVVLVERITQWLANTKIRRRLDRTTGLVLIGFGLRLVTDG
jgi:threonine/homoserine/homoserine lactone efflux protein